MRISFGPFAACMLVLALGPTAKAAAADFATALKTRDQNALTAFSKQGATTIESQVATAELHAMRREDEAAIAGFLGVLPATSDSSLKADVEWELSSVYLRAGLYRNSAEAARAAVAADPSKVDEGQKRQLGFVEALEDAKPQKLTIGGSGTVNVERDLAGLPRVIMTVNSEPQPAVFDTGAGFSVMTASLAAKLSLRLMPKPITVKNSVGGYADGRIGIADRVTLGNAVYENVAFIVMPDDALSFAGGVYKIPAIIGMPMMIPLQTISMAKTSHGETLTFRDQGGAGGASNLTMDGQELHVTATLVEGARQARLVLDTGADRTTLNGSAANAYPTPMTSGQRKSFSTGGAGGSKKDEEGFVLDDVTLRIAETAVVIKKLRVRSHTDDVRDGVLGQDALKSGFFLDFDDMRLTVGH